MLPWLVVFALCLPGGRARQPVHLQIRPGDYVALARGETVVDSRESFYTYRLEKTEETKMNTSTVAISACVRCPAPGKPCPLAQDYFPETYVEKDRRVKIPLDLMRTLSRWPVAYSADAPADLPALSSAPGHTIRLTFTPDYSLLTAVLTRCRTDKLRGSPPRPVCTAFKIRQLTPITCKGNPEVAVGFVGYQKCN